jgi:MYXO-CTERM domain-containing protein
MSDSPVQLALRPALLAGIAAAFALNFPFPAPPPSTKPPPSSTAEALATRQPGLRRPARMPRPAPVEARLDPAYEKDNKARRKAWSAARHRAAPETDWKALERANGERLSRLAGRPPAPPAPVAGAWIERGSDNQAGRMHAAALGDDGALYAGSALGGVWRGTPDGDTWTPLADGIYGGAHWLFASGRGADEPDALLIATAWTGLHHSPDGGATWARPTGLPDIWMVRAVEQASDDDDVLYALTTDYWTWHLSRSDDRGATFTVLASWTGGAGDLWADRTGGADLYLLRDNEVLHSADRGATFTPRGRVPSSAAEGRLAGSEAGAPRLWAALQGGGASGVELWRSDDAGATWDRLPDLTDHWGVIEGSTVDADLLAHGGVEAHVSRDGGASFEVVNPWWDYYSDPATLLHADMMAFVVAPTGPGAERWLLGTDGGLYASDDGLETVRNLSLDGLRVSQYYSTHTSAANPEHLQAGSQDQGYQVTQGVAQDDDVLGFAQILSGDYGHLSSSDGTHGLVYSTYPGFVLVSVGEDEPWLAYVDYPPGQNLLWLPPVVADPTDPEAFFLVGDPLWRFERVAEDRWEGEAWTAPTFSSDGYETLSALRFAPSDPQIAYAATSYGRLFRSDDGGRTFTESPDRGPGSHYFYGTALVVHPTDPQRVWAGGAGYEGPAVYASADGGATWTGMAEGLGPTLVYSLALSRDGDDRLFAGTETGAWAYDADAGAWSSLLGDVAPVTIYWSAEALPHENTVRFGTYGRGIWDYTMDTPSCYPVVDADGDGVDCRTDCAEGDPAVHPGADDPPGDGVDSDCDGEDGPAGGDGGDGGDPDGADGGGAADAGGSPKDAGCACASAPARAPWALLLPVLGLPLLRRRR